MKEQAIFHLNSYLNTSSLFLGNGTTVGVNGAFFNGLSLAFITFVACTFDSTKKECQWVCSKKKKNGMEKRIKRK